jgi:hypothetical protein
MAFADTSMLGQDVWQETLVAGRGRMKVVASSLLAGTLVLVGVAAAKDVPDVPQMAPMALNSYTWVPRNIGTANVLDLDGDLIGRVQKFNVDQSGKPQGLGIWLSGSGKVIDVAASNISYDEGQNIVTVGLNRGQLAQISREPHQ